jgi:hypothetical protein
MFLRLGCRPYNKEGSVLSDKHLWDASQGLVRVNQSPEDPLVMGQLEIGMHKIHTIFSKKEGCSAVKPNHWPPFGKAPAQHIAQQNTLPYVRVNGWSSNSDGRNYQCWAVQ